MTTTRTTRQGNTKGKRKESAREEEIPNAARCESVADVRDSRLVRLGGQEVVVSEKYLHPKLN